jgi:hypothetical protein
MLTQVLFCQFLFMLITVLTQLSLLQSYWVFPPSVVWGYCWRKWHIRWTEGKNIQEARWSR